MVMLGEYAFYTRAQNLDSDGPQFVLMMVNLITRTQEVLLEGDRWLPLALVDEGSTILLASIYEGGTYKYNLRSRELTYVADKIWLGSTQ
jgi:hypothetical protein